MWISFGGYVLLYVANHYLFHVNHLSGYWAIPFVLGVLACDILAIRQPAFTAVLIAKRHIVADALMVASLLVGTLALLLSNTAPALDYSSLVLPQFALQGAVVGVVVRMLVLAVFARLLKGSHVEIHRLFLLVALTIFLWLFPFLESHRLYAGFYLYGFGLGFWIHYLVRNKEHLRAQTARHSRNITELLGNSVKLTGMEVDAVKHYARQAWRHLDRLFSNTEHHPTTVLAIIKASAQRLKGRYDEARTTIDVELARDGHDTSLDTFLYLHKALSLGDLNLKAEMRETLQKASQCEANCLLTLVTKGLRIAEELPFLEEVSPSDASHEDQRHEALKFIWEALKLNEVARPELIARIVGRTVPVTWTFLLDAYAYVLLKAGHHRFSRALLIDCIYEDPYFSAPYLHLGEWCIAELLKASRPNSSASDEVDGAQRPSMERSRRVAPLCLNIAIRLEGGRRSLTKRRARELLDRYSNLFSQTE